MSVADPFPLEDFALDALTYKVRYGFGTGPIDVRLVARLDPGFAEAMRNAATAIRDFEESLAAVRRITETAKPALRAMSRQIRRARSTHAYSGHRHRGTRAWARRYAHR